MSWCKEPAWASAPDFLQSSASPANVVYNTVFISQHFHIYCYLTSHPPRRRGCKDLIRGAAGPSLSRPLLWQASPESGGPCPAQVGLGVAPWGQSSGLTVIGWPNDRLIHGLFGADMVQTFPPGVWEVQDTVDGRAERPSSPQTGHSRCLWLHDWPGRPESHLAQVHPELTVCLGVTHIAL